VSLCGAGDDHAGDVSVVGDGDVSDDNGLAVREHKLFADVRCAIQGDDKSCRSAARVDHDDTERHTFEPTGLPEALVADASGGVNP
jgi:hypothetical protein